LLIEHPKVDLNTSFVISALLDIVTENVSVICLLTKPPELPVALGPAFHEPLPEGEPVGLTFSRRQ